MREYLPDLLIYGDGHQAFDRFCKSIRFSTHCNYLIVSELSPVNPGVHEFMEWLRPDQVDEIRNSHADGEIAFSGRVFRSSAGECHARSFVGGPTKASGPGTATDELLRRPLSNADRFSAFIDRDCEHSDPSLLVDILFDFEGEARILGAVLLQNNGGTHYIFDSTELEYVLGANRWAVDRLGLTNQFVTLEVASFLQGARETQVVYNEYGLHWDLYRAAGINLPLISIQNLLKRKVQTLRFVESKDIRCLARQDSIHFKFDYDTVYFDLDETLVWNGKPIRELVEFLFAQKRLGKTIILITRHTNDVVGTLSQIEVDSSVFDEIIVVAPDELKSSYINRRGSIFIDNEFPQRLDVRKNCGIPVLNLDQIDFVVSEDS